MDGHRGAWRVPGYTEVRDLGVGASGRVVMARHDADQTPVAIKYLSGDLCADPGFIIRFRHEARLLELVNSPYAARFYEYVESDEGAAIVMELVDGVSLRAMLRSEGPTGAEAALLVLKGALLGLAAAHAGGIVHRDFKPENIMIEAGGASKVVDFGIAVRSGEGVSGSGTPPYMAPEQWAGAPAGPGTDVYAATIVFFECLTGTRPFQAPNIAALARQHQTMPPPVEQVPAPLWPLVERGMAKHPADRPATAADFVDELEAVAAESYGADWEERGRRRLAALAGLLALLFPLAEESGSATSLADTELGGRRGMRRLSTKIAIGAVGVAALAGLGAVLVGTLGDSTLQAQTSVVTPSATPPDVLGSTGPAAPETAEPSGEPSPADPTASPSPVAPTGTAAPPGTTAAPTAPARPTRRATPATRPPRPPRSPAASPSGSPSDDARPPVDDPMTTRPRPRPTPTPAEPTPRPAPSTTAPPEEPEPSPSPSSPPPRGEGRTSSGSPSASGSPNPGDPPPAALVTLSAIGGTLAVTRRTTGRHRGRS
ncbi:hypothetical protein Sru01_34020 [Sphaerisporangium rufum]|uniref:non-specific serine/threonine protein kinase n=1 Tax=Sphaerisporangium rufum TaxID=1381558 RepID=A0A919V5L6_9ACTN|nr:serine/threonine-protein kinase [Sphaerisporangium rufum]GII78420.1 hypothetical protein Sru01_34020 [Sphaerisporangium rufum]